MGTPKQRPESPEQREKTNGSSFLRKINEYKELIAVIIFFLAGVIWIYGYFATKSQVDLLIWYTTTYDTMIEDRLAASILRREIDEDTDTVNMLRKSVDCKAGCQQKIKSLERKIKEKLVKLNRHIKDAELAHADIKKMVRRIYPQDDSSQSN